MSEDSEQVITGFVHNVSPVKKGPRKHYFDFNLQTGEKTTVRSICFSTPKRKIFAEAEEKLSPVKIKKFLHDKKEDSTDILISDNVIVEKLKPEDVSFERKELVSGNLNLSTLNMVSVQQLVSIKAKVINMQPESNVNMPDGVLRKVEALLIDPHGLFKIVVWGEDIKKVREGGTYEFKNLRLKRNKFKNELYVNPAKDNSDITECDAFEEMLVAPENMPDEFLVCDIKGEVIGISDIQLDLCCVKCNRHIKSQQTQMIVVCGDHKCNLKQKAVRCSKEWYLKAFVASEETTFNLVFRHEMVLKAMTLNDPTTDSTKLSENAIEDAFFSFPLLKFKYQKKTMVVTDIERCVKQSL